MATGKTNAAFGRIFVDEVNLSGDARGFGSLGIEYEEHAADGWSDGVEFFTLGRPSISLSGFQALFNNTASTGSFSELKDREEYLVSFLLGVRTAPAVGDMAFSSPLEASKMVIDGSGSILIATDFIGPGQGDTLPTSCFGVVLEVGATSRVATLTGTSVDNGASTANGALGYLHVTVSDAGTWSLKIQDSPNDSAWSDLITFTADGSAITAEQASVAGTVDQWTRVLFTRTSGAITAACTIIRL